MKKYKSKANYFLLTLLMSCNFVSASDQNNIDDIKNNVHQTRILTYPPYLSYPLHSDTSSNYSKSFPQRTYTYTSTDIDFDKLPKKKENSFSKTTCEDWSLYKYPEDNQQKTSYAEESFTCRLNYPLQRITIGFATSNQFTDIICYLNPSYSTLSEYKEKYPHSKAGSNGILRFTIEDDNPEANLAPYKALYEINVLPDFIIDRILKFPNFKVMDFRTDFECLKTKIEQLSISSYAQDQETEPLSQSSVGAEDLLEVITNHVSRISNDQQRQEVCWDAINYLRHNTEGSELITLELCKKITDKNLPFYKDAHRLAVISDFSEALMNNNINRNYKLKTSLLEITSQDTVSPILMQYLQSLSVN